MVGFMGEHERILEYVQDEFTEPIRDPVWKHIYVSRELLQILALPAFQKLGRIRQLGPAGLVYPGATHTRLSHSLGVLHIARRMIVTLARRSRRTVAGVPPVDMRLDDVKAFLCASLLHDIGHYPYAHSLKDLQVEAHEKLTARLILGPLAAPIRSALGVEPGSVAAIIDSGGTAAGARGAGIYGRILSGALDPDKLDYLNRDAFFCGVPYGIQDVDFILEETYPHPVTGVCISRKGITALEDVLFSKYLMYKTVYWHKTVRIATAMIKKAVSLGLAGGLIHKEDLYGLDDDEFGRLFTEERSPAFRLIQDVRNRRLYRRVLRVPFRDESPIHRRLEDVGERMALEERIASEAGELLGRRVPGEWVVIDIPERVSFEMEIPVREEHGDTVPSRITADHLFAGQSSEDLPRSLRSISLCALRDDGLSGALARMDLPRLLGDG